MDPSANLPLVTADAFFLHDIKVLFNGPQKLTMEKTMCAEGGAVFGVGLAQHQLGHIDQKPPKNERSNKNQAIHTSQPLFQASRLLPHDYMGHRGLA